MNPALAARSISKSFGVVQALSDVDFEAYDGEIHGVVGENGAGKTTLMRIFYGATSPSSGHIERDGHRAAFRDTASAIRAGVGMVSQHYSIIPQLTCLQNLMLGAEPSLVLHPRENREKAKSLAAQMGFEFDWNARAETLSPGAAQKLEILKLLWRGSEVLILDEPTAMLSPADSTLLYQSLRALADEGRSVIVVTHRLPEVLAHCDRATVLRSGRVVATKAVGETSVDELARMVVGHALREPAPRGEPSPEPWLEVRDLCVRGPRGDMAVQNAGFTLRRGEVLGLAGVDGNGQRELFHALLGVLPAQCGEIRLADEDWSRKSTRERLRQGLRLIAEDRLAEAAIENWSLELNGALGLQRDPELSAGPLVRPRRRRDHAEALRQKFDTRASSVASPMRDLSGGNQQRFVAARALSLHPRLVLAFQPARGLDLDATHQLHEELRRVARENGAALLASFDLDELLDQCDRVLAISRGRIYEPEPGKERNRDAIGRLMLAGGQD